MGKALEKQINTIKDQGETQIETLRSIKKLSVKDVIPNSPFATDEAKEELNKIKETEKMWTEKNYFINQIKIPIILKNFKQ